MRTIHCALAAAILFASAAARADEPVAAPATPSSDEVQLTGVYLGFGGGVSSVKSRDYDQDTSDPIWGFTLGYSFTPNFAVQLVQTTMSFRLFDFDDTYYPHTHWGVAAVGTVPIGGRFQLVGTLGTGKTKMRSANRELHDYKVSDPNVGLGARMDFSQRWSMDLTATRYTKSHVTTTFLGFKFRF